MRKSISTIILVLIAALVLVSMVGCVSAEGDGTGTGGNNGDVTGNNDLSETPKKPIISTFTCTTSSPKSGDTVQFSFSVTGATKIEIEYTQNSGFVDVTGKTDASHTYPDAGKFKATLKATSESGDTTEETCDVTIDANISKIKTITITGLTEPKIGAAPVKNITLAENDKATVNLEWVPTGTKKFEVGETYKAEITITAKTNYEFEQDLTVKINGKQITSGITQNKDKVVIIYEYQRLTYTEISTVSISGLTPLADERPNYSPIVSTEPKDGIISPATSSASWKLSNGNEMSSKFQASESYKVTVTLKPDDGYIFKTGINVTVDGEIVRPSSESDSTKLVINKTYSSIGGSVGDIELILTEPTDGKTPSSTAKVISPEKGVKNASVSWSPSDSTFDEDKEYIATITISPDSGYTFTASNTVKLNGKTVTATLNSSGKLVLEKTFSGKYVTDVHLTIPKPVIDAKPAETATSSTNGVKSSNDISWNPSDTKFKEGFTYTPTISVETKSGYTFGYKPNIYVNDELVDEKNITRTSDTKLNVKAPYMTTDETISKVDVTLSEPVAGSNATNAKITSPASGVSASVSWSPALTGNKFGGYIAYTATITLTSNSLEFTSSPKVTVNGSNVTVKRQSDKVLSVEYTFSQTGATPTPTKTTTQTQKPTATQTSKPTETLPEDTEVSDIPNPLLILHEFIELLLALFDPATYGISFDE